MLLASPKKDFSKSCGRSVKTEISSYQTTKSRHAGLDLLIMSPRTRSADCVSPDLIR